MLQEKENLFEILNLNTKWMMYGVCHNVVVTAGQYYS
jgi:hypothetical protein